MSSAEIDPESRCRIPLIRRGELDADGQKAYDFYTSGTMRGLHGPAGIWLHSPKLAELYRPLGTYLRSGAGLSEPVREVCILATAREFNNAFEWAAHEPEALRVGVPQEVIQSIKLRQPSAEMGAPYGTVVELIRQAFTAGSVSAQSYDAAVSLLGVRLLIDLMSLAGMYASTAALLTVFDMQLDRGETHLLPSLT
ncbi:MAG: 4-carboxymuconolactone decarboxylase [Mycobacterium sp.]|jgi:4-carboxymuconolactone decarboxylase|nr:4-carboxymuconolactone decarboxylase [Mycobacterium sp.]MDT5256503.1 4-carboxymuconolactone decarboxylase [Mycobacterium sp.]